MPRPKREPTTNARIASVSIPGQHLDQDQHSLWQAIGGTVTRQFLRRDGAIAAMRLSYWYDMDTLEVMLAAHLHPVTSGKTSMAARLWREYCERTPGLGDLGARILAGEHGLIEITERMLALMLGKPVGGKNELTRSMYPKAFNPSRA